MSCGVHHRHSSDPLLLWLSCRLAAVAPIQPLAWELLCAAGSALKSKTTDFFFFFLLWDKCMKWQRKLWFPPPVPLFFIFGSTHATWKFSGQGSNLSCSCDLCHGCSNGRSLTHCTMAETACVYFRENSCVPVIHFVLLLLSCKTSVMSHQDIDMDAVKI